MTVLCPHVKKLNTLEGLEKDRLGCVRRKTVRDGKKRMDWEIRNGVSEISSNFACSGPIYCQLLHSVDSKPVMLRGEAVGFPSWSCYLATGTRGILSVQLRLNQYFGLQDWIALRLCLIQLGPIGYTNLKDNHSAKVFLRDSRPKSLGQHP